MAADIRFLAAAIAAEINARADQVIAAIGLIDEGATIPFIARYRKEVTGGLDDTQLRLSVRAACLSARVGSAPHFAMIESIDEQGKLTEELQPAGDNRRRPRPSSKTSICRSSRKAPHQGRDRARARPWSARRSHSGPIAAPIREARGTLYHGRSDGTKEALEGARDIVIETISENAALLGRASPAHARQGAC
jgi:uncharacterized protein